MMIQLSDHFSYRKLIRFVLPSIGMMVFTSIYGVVDGFFVSNFAGGTPFAAINLIMPFLMIFSTIGFMFGAGGTALVAMKFGEGKSEEANQIFSLIVYTLIGIGLVMTIIGEIFLEKVSLALGATPEMLPYCVSYGRLIMIALVPFMLQNLFQSFLVTAERPAMGFVVTVIAGVTNMVLDALLVGVLRMGVTGAALATGISQAVGGLIPLIYFIFPNHSPLRLGKARKSIRPLIKTCTNGASEFMTNVSMSVVNMLYNFQLLKFAGEHGVAAYGVIMYVNFIFVSVFIGYSIGMAPIVGYNYGAANHDELKNIYKKSLQLIAAFAVLMTVSAQLLAMPLAKFYVGYDAELLAMTERGFRIFAISFLILGFNIFGSAFFTALNNGLISAVLSFFRMFVFQVVAVFLLPVFFGLDGIWSAIVFAELLSLAMTVYFFIKKKKTYHYM